MRPALKQNLQELVDSSIKDFQGKNSLSPGRIVLYTSVKIRNPVLVFHFLQNRFYNTQWYIDNQIPVKIIPYYKENGRYEIDNCVDYPIDVGDYLKIVDLKDSAFLET